MVNVNANIIGLRHGESAASIASAFTSRVVADGGIVEANQCLIDRINLLKTLGMWDKASAVWLPHGYKEDKFYAIKGGPTADLVFTRNGTRTRKGPTYVEQVPANLKSTSNTFSVVGGATITSSYGISPEGYSTTLLTHGPSGNDGCAFAANTATGLVPGQTYTLSFYGRKVTGNGGYGLRVDSNLTVGIVSTTGTLTSDWTRVQAPFVMDAGATSLSGQTRIRLGTGVVGETIELYGVMINAGGTALPYFPTSDRLDVPAFDYTSGACPSLSMEPSRTNLFLQSEDFSTTWTNSNSSESVNQILGPDGLSTADKLIDDNTNNNHDVRTSITKAGSAITYAMSIHAKKAEINWLRITAFTSGTEIIRAWFDVNNGVVGSIQSAGTFIGVSSKIVNCGNGWYRCIAVFTTDTSIGLTTSFGLQTADLQTAYLGNGTNGMYIWGAQLEQGVYATSYIPTTTATVTRITDSITGLTGVSNLIGQTEGTLYWEGSSFDDGIAKVPLSLSDGTINNRIIIQLTSSGNIQGAVVFGGVTIANIAVPYISDTYYKVAVVYRSNYVALFINGVKKGEDLSVSIPTCSRIGFDRASPTDNFYGYGRCWAISKQAISDAEAITLTTP